MFPPHGTWIMTIQIHNEMQSISSTNKYESIELNDYVFMKKLKSENYKRVYNSPLCFKRIGERKSEI